MKTKKTKFFAAFLAMACCAFTACKPGSESGNTTNPPASVKITLAATQYAVEVGSAVQIEATVSPAGTALSYTSLDATVATVDANGLVTGVKAGNTIVTVAAGTEKANCIINVIDAGGTQPGETPTVKGSKIWPIILDADIKATVEDKIGYDFRTNDVDRMLYIWDGTYVGGGASGVNYFQTNSNGGFLSLKVNEGVTWSGCGFMIKSTNLEAKTAMNELVAAIKANPSKFHLHMAIKTTDPQANHYFTLFGLGGDNTTGLKWCVGDKYEPESNGRFNIVADGTWNVITFAFDRYIAPLEKYAEPAEDKGINYFTFGSGGVAGSTLNIDAVYIYQE